VIPEESNCFKEMIWNLNQLIEIKVKLNDCKKLLNDKNLKEWSTHTSLTDRSERITHYIDKRLQTKPLLLTRAWLKFFEILSNYKLIGSDLRSRVRALFVCEGPGGFVNAFNHFIKTHFNNQLIFEWMANTLNPYYEDIDYTIIDDTFIKDIYCYNKWFFGSTNTGNILDKSFLSDLRKQISSETKFDLITCDGSVNCVDCPESQEEVIIPLLFSEIIISLNVIKENGSLVVKCFTLFECQTQCLLYLLCCAFSEVHVFKPTASKSGNSEIYLICLGFKDSIQLKSILSILSEHNITTNSKAIFSRESVSEKFFTKLEECVKLFASRQQMTIENNLKLFKKMTETEKREIINDKKYVAKSFVKKYNIFSISISEQLTPNTVNEQNNCLNFKKLRALTFNTKSYNSRKQNDFFSQIWFQKLNRVLFDINNDFVIDNKLNDFNYWKSTNLKTIKINLVYGLPYNQILCSKFCDLSLLNSYNQCMKYSNPNFEQIGKNFTSFSFETLEILRKLISSFETNIIFNHVICLRNNNHFTQQFIQLLIKEKLETICDFQNIPIESNSRKMFIINVFDKFSLELIQEKVFLKELVSHLNEIISFIGENDLLVIQIGFSLSRLTTAILYLLSRIFKSYAIVPCFGSDLTNRHGLICLFDNRIDDKHNSQISHYFKDISNQLNSLIQSKEDSNRDLVEIISVPIMISGILLKEFQVFPKF
jgi:23S rRNA U2552 (ribose-2'-O)-methylase RlmE/FtsJ